MPGSVKNGVLDTLARLIEEASALALVGIKETGVRVCFLIDPQVTFVLVDKSVYALNARRPWLPAVAVKWLDQRRGRWMYPARGPVRERWFWPSSFANRLGRLFGEVRVEHLITPEEAAHPLFRRVPGARLLTLWSARVPGGAHV